MLTQKQQILFTTKFNDPGEQAGERLEPEAEMAAAGAMPGGEGEGAWGPQPRRRPPALLEGPRTGWPAHTVRRPEHSPGGSPPETRRGA